MKKTILFLYLVSFAALLPAQQNNVLQVSNLDSVEEIALDKFWKFHNGDDSLWALSTFDDSKWDTVNTNLMFGEDGSNPFTGIGWFRIHIYLDSSFNEIPIAVLVEQDGASQIFIDGKLIQSFGTVSADVKKEIPYNPNNIPHSFRYGKPGEHILAVRYSNHNYRNFFEKYGHDSPGFRISLSKQDNSVVNTFLNTMENFVFLIVLAIFFLTLSFVHLLFFLFYRKQRTNIYYSIFVMLLAALFIILAISSNTLSPELSIKLNYSSLYFITTLFFSLLLLHYSLFKRPFGKYFWFSTLIFIAVIIGIMSGKSSIIYYFFLSFTGSTVIASFFIVTKSILNKIEGAWIVGTGSLLFLILSIFTIVKLAFFGNSLHVDSFFFFLMILLAIMSIPISMSIHLAREFAQTNKNLEKQLVEVETLSQKTIEQEKEKQKNLETQKEILEIQVIERTSEIVAQKKIIEEKNQDITDSINYAKTIQEAILPSKELKHKLFSDSFILFKPKDIVSGDFYWFAEKNGKKIIAACDCTGHGVPGALMSMIGNNILNQVVNEKGITSPHEILNHLHKGIRKTLKQEEQDETNDGMDISVITFNNETEIEFAGAQRPLWIISPPHLPEEESTQPTSQSDGVAGNSSSPSGSLGGASLIEIKGNKFAIGGSQSESERKFTNHTISLSKGDCIYIFSDGFADQFSDIDKKLMTSRFKELLLSVNEKSMLDQVIFLDDFIEKWRGKREQIDDMLVIGMRI